MQPCNVLSWVSLIFVFITGKKKSVQIYQETWQLRYEKKNRSTSILWHSGNCLHDTDKVIFIVTELSKHIKQPTSHDLPRKQQKPQVSRLPANTYKCWLHTAKHTALTVLSSTLHTHELGDDRRAWTLQSWAWKAWRRELISFVGGRARER